MQLIINYLLSKDILDISDISRFSLVCQITVIISSKGTFATLKILVFLNKFCEYSSYLFTDNLVYAIRNKC
jgi:hypothetical protein